MKTATKKTSKTTPYKAMEAISREAQVLGGISALLGWDQETYMPEDASPVRGEQLEAMASLIHKKKTSPKWSKALAKLIDLKSGEIVAPDLSTEEQAAAKLWLRDFKEDTSLPDRFVKQFARLTSQSMVVWRDARKENAFRKFAPFLEKIVDLNKRKADYVGYKDHPYDALINEYEPGMTTKEIRRVFAELKPKLKGLLQHIQSRPQVDASFLSGDFDPAVQFTSAQELLDIIQFPFNRGRLDLSAHPFSSGSHPTDCRITTRIRPEEFLSNLTATLHEAGHAFYELGLPVEHFSSPLGHSVSMGLHESQSRWWETRIGLSRPFWDFYYPKLQKAFPGKFDRIPLDVFYKGVNQVSPSFIRVEADEVTYPLHIMLRLELEIQMIEGSLKIRDLPDAWNAQMQDLLGITPATNTEGCLQDIHWSMGAMGYFPTYSLGNIYAAQLFDAFAKQNPKWEDQVRAGNFQFIKDWLSQNVWKHGRRYDSQVLVEKVTGHPFSSVPYAQYLENKYRKIYG